MFLRGEIFFGTFFFGTFSRFSMISLSKLLREIIENLEKSATPNFGELEKIFSGEDFFLVFFSVKELDRIFHFRYFRAPRTAHAPNGSIFRPKTTSLSDLFGEGFILCTHGSDNHLPWFGCSCHPMRYS